MLSTYEAHIKASIGSRLEIQNDRMINGQQEIPARFWKVPENQEISTPHTLFQNTTVKPNLVWNKMIISSHVLKCEKDKLH